MSEDADRVCVCVQVMVAATSSSVTTRWSMSQWLGHKRVECRQLVVHRYLVEVRGLCFVLEDA